MAEGAPPAYNPNVKYVDQYGNPVPPPQAQQQGGYQQPMAHASGYGGYQQPQPVAASGYQGYQQPQFMAVPAQQQNQYAHEPMARGQFTTYEGEFGHCGSSKEYGHRLDFSNRKYNDLWAAFVWIATVIGLIVFVVYEYTGSSVEIDGSANENGIAILAVCAVAGICIGIGYMFALRSCAAGIIKFMLYGNLVWLAICALIAVLIGNIVMVIICLIFLVLFGLYVYWVRRRIPLAATMLEIGSRIIQTYNATIWMNLLLVALTVAYIFVWVLGASAYANSDDQNNLVIFGLILIFYWSLQVFTNIGHFTVCGVTGAWYFTPENSMMANPTWHSFKAACSTSLGSIAFGSLLVAVIQTVRAIVQNARNNNRMNAIVACLIVCILDILDRLVRFFNNLAYVQCALYGTAFVESAKRTWDLVKKKGLDAWINDDLTGFALSCGAFIGAIGVAIVALVLATTIDSAKNDRYTYAVAGWLIGYFLCVIVLYTVRSAVFCQFVAWCEDPYSLQKNHPTEHAKFTAAWEKIYGRRRY